MMGPFAHTIPARNRLVEEFVIVDRILTRLGGVVQTEAQNRPKTPSTHSTHRNSFKEAQIEVAQY
jgi:hypothetical protein